MAKAPADALNAELQIICEALEARYGRRKFGPFEDFIEAMIYQILELGCTEKTARDAYKRLRDEYVDWNDMRVATVREIEDILGPRYYRVREKSEDLKHLLADIYTAFRRMDIKDALAGDGVATLRALPDTTNIRRDMIEKALLSLTGGKICPLDDDQFKLLKFLSGGQKTLGPAIKPLSYQLGARKLEELVDLETLLRLSRGLREHSHFCQSQDEDEPQPISFGWDKKDPLGMDKPATGKKKK